MLPQQLQFGGTRQNSEPEQRARIENTQVSPENPTSQDSMLSYLDPADNEALEKIVGSGVAPDPPAVGGSGPEKSPA